MQKSENLRHLLKFSAEEFMEHSSTICMAHYGAYSLYVKYLDKLKHLYIGSKKFPQEIT